MRARVCVGVAVAVAVCVGVCVCVSEGCSFFAIDGNVRDVTTRNLIMCCSHYL